MDAAPLTGKSPAIALWTRKTNNIFRGVLELECTNSTPEDIAALVLQTVSAEYTPGPVVPFAFGTVLRFKYNAPFPEALEHLIDDRSRNRGTWQWLVVTDETTKSAYGIHMWSTGYLTPVFSSLLEHLQTKSYSCNTIVKEPGKFWERLWAMSASLVKVRKVLVYAGSGLALLVIAAQVLLAR
ncbi:hypothetical protein ASC95_16380 [Pelomonas sp. Root1217]|nr:hypothetical protein ASC95_16380 [Pelomonas sp. Root1217]